MLLLSVLESTFFATDPFKNDSLWSREDLWKVISKWGNAGTSLSVQFENLKVHLMLESSSELKVLHK